MRATPPRLILTTEEVLTEYLNYFAAWGPDFRRTATTNIGTCALVAPSGLFRKAWRHFRLA
jgi:hypothetical protein